MPFARFMELALYDPDGGYYRAADARPGRGGDFVTAPELHPIFGEMLARAVEDAWVALGRPEPFMVREHGAGEGALALAMLGGPPAGDRLCAASRSTSAGSATLRDRLDEAGLADRLAEATEPPFDGVVIGNEVLDALPVHRVRQVGGALRELAVDLGEDGEFVEVEVEPTTPALAGRLTDEGIELVEGQTAEICLALDAWIAAAAADLRRGLVVLIDYGYPAAELYDPRPPPRRHAARVRPPPGRRRPVSLRRPAGPDRACRRDRGAGGCRGCRSHDARHHDPGGGADGARHRGPPSRDPVRPRDDDRGLHAPARGAAAPARPGRDGPVPGHGLRPRLAPDRRAVGLLGYQLPGRPSSASD